MCTPEHDVDTVGSEAHEAMSSGSGAKVYLKGYKFALLVIITGQLSLTLSRFRYCNTREFSVVPEWFLDFN